MGVATEQLIFDLLARDNASAAILRLAGSADKASGSTAGLLRRLDEVSRKSVSARVGLEGDTAANASIDRIQARLITLGRQTANPNIGIEGIARAAAQISALDVELDHLRATEKEVAATSWVTSLASAAAIVNQPLAGGGWFSALRGFHVPLFAGALTKMGVPAILATASGFHLLSEAVIETTAVVVPATIALGAFGVGAAPTVADIYKQMKNLYTVSQALDVQMPGMTGGFSKMVAAVKPEVYSLFGDALEIIDRKGSGLQTMATGAGAALDQLASRFTLAVTSGNGMTKFADNAVTDLSKLDDILGNLGGTFGNLLHVMPGYAADLLNVADAGTKVLEWATKVAGPVIGFGLSLHGAIFYAGLLTTALVKLGTTVIPSVGLGVISAGAKLGVFGEKSLGAAKALGATDLQLTKIADSLGGVIGPQGFVKVGTEAEQAATRTGVLGVALNVLTKVPVWGWVAVGASVVGVLAYKELTAKDATTQWAQALLTAAENQSTFTGILAATDGAILKIDVAQRGATSSLKYLTNSSTMFGASQAVLTQQYGIQAQRINDLNAARKQATGLQATEDSRAWQLIATFGSLSKAYGIFSLVNIKANAIAHDTAAQWAADINTAKSYLGTTIELAGYQGGRALAAQQALTLAASGQAAAVQKVTQAEDAYINTLIGGEQAFVTWMQDLAQTEKAARATGATIGGLNKNSLTLAGDYWSTLIPASQKQIDALNAQFIGTKQLTTAVATIAKGLLPFAAHNTAARAAVMDLVNNALGPGTVSLRDMNRWVGSNSTSLRGFKSIVDQSTVAASQLAKGLQNDLNVQFHQDLLATTGASAALKAYTADLDHNRQDTAAGRSDRAQLIKDLINSGLSAKQAATQVDAMTRSLGKVPHHEAIGITMRGDGSYSITAGVSGPQGGKTYKQGFAGGGLITAGTGPAADDVLIRASKGELVVPAHYVKAGLVDHLRGKLPGFAAGGLVTQGNMAVLSGQYATQMTSAFTHQMESAMVTAMRAAIRTASAAGVAGYGGGFSASAQAAQAFARSLFPSHGWGMSQWLPLLWLWAKESGWNASARNPSSGAAGIPQDITGNFHGGYQGQVIWGENYIGGRYGTPAAAWAHEKAFNWYGSGLEPTVFRRPALIGVGESGPEEVSVRPLSRRRGAGAMVVEGPLMDHVTIQDATDVNLVARQLAFQVTSYGIG